MTPSDLEKFYQLGNIEGVAFVNSAGLLIEDQLILSSGAAEAVATGFDQIHRGLASADRICNGFLARFSEYQFLSIRVDEGIIILQLNPDEEVNDSFRQVLAMANYSGATKSEDEAVVIEQPAAAANTKSSKTWDTFQLDLVKVMTSVAPNNLAKKLTADAVSKVMGNSQNVPGAEQMLKIGAAAAAFVPNKGRRKLIDKELDLLYEKLGLN